MAAILLSIVWRGEMNDRDRSKLHKYKLDQFISWCVHEKQYAKMEPKGQYEAFRIIKDKKLIVGHKRDRTNHITITNDGIKLVNEWLRSKRRGT